MSRTKSVVDVLIEHDIDSDIVPSGEYTWFYCTKCFHVALIPDSVLRDCTHYFDTLIKIFRDKCVKK